MQFAKTDGDTPPLSEEGRHNLVRLVEVLIEINGANAPFQRSGLKCTWVRFMGLLYLSNYEKI